MQILELLVYEENEGLFSEFSQFLPLVKVAQQNLPTYRLEIDRQLVLLVYYLSKDQNYSLQYLKNVFPHLTRLLWLSNKKGFEDLTLPEELQAIYEENDSSLPSTIVLAADRHSTEAESDSIMETGFNLNTNSRLIFWNREDQENVHRIWQKMWGEW
jgi:hypothetical protein